MATTPDSVSYPTQDYGILGPLPAYVVNLQDIPGADPTGNDDSTLAINTALASLPDDGGELVIAPGIYRFSGPLRAKSNTVMSGSGTLKAAPFEAWVPNGEYWGITNVNNDATEITDENITVRDITIDYTDFPTAPVGTRFAMYFRMAQNVRNINVRTIKPTNHVAHRACNQAITTDPHSVDFTNCGIDHWEETNDVTINGGYLESVLSNQMVNFNPEDNNLSTDTHCARFTMTGVTMVNSGSGDTAVLLEPLYNSGSTVRDVVVSGCIFKGTRLAIRGATTNVTVTGNTFDVQNTGEVILSYTHLGGSPAGIVVSNNVINDPITTAMSSGVIRVETDDASIIGNVIRGTNYTAVPVATGAFKPNVLANRIDGSLATGVSGMPKWLQSGFRLLNSADNFIAIEDASGTTGLRAYIQSDNQLIFESTDGVGAARPFMTLTARNSSSDLSVAIRMVVSDILRLAPQTGVTATGTVSGDALLITRNFCEVTTVAAGTGVRLPGPGGQAITGARIVVWNAGANTLNVYPMAGGQIDALGTDTADTIASGGCKTYVALSATLYRVET